MMGRFEKLISKILSGRHDANVQFSEILSLMRKLGFTLRIQGSHHILFRDGIAEIINIQPDGSKAKPYQIRQIRELIVKYKLEEEDA
jgi:predicted RNA binding protein YcfA (HicA-like mRNA interferase family)